MAFQIIKGDITGITADAIVNSANPEPIYARGVDAAIYLPVKYIIHTVGPIWAGWKKAIGDDVKRRSRKGRKN